MNRASRTVALALALFPCVACTPQAQTVLPAPPTPPAAEQLSSDKHLVITLPIEEPEALAATVDEIVERFGVTLAAEWPLQSLDVYCLVVEADDAAEVEALIERMEADAQIRTVQRMQVFSTSTEPYPDPLFPAQTSLGYLNILAAHSVSTGAGVTVGVVDSAIDGTHPDLAANVRDLRDFVGDDRAVLGEAHGTAIAGIIAADATNRFGMVGVAPEAELVSLRACWQPGTGAGECNSFSLARAVNFAILNDVDVLNMSLGGRPDPLLAELLRAAREAGIVVVAAWGEAPAPAFPASVPGVIAAGDLADGPVPAPSVDVLSAAPGGDYDYFSGSSVAAAHVSGVVALMLAADDTLGSDEILRTFGTARALHNGRPMLDACEALRTSVDPALACGPRVGG
ncbi:S8 family peptidase [Pontivivens ytuae]|uniref:S8 family serine peptidase n=1 Tax=Pontivivens ytuae TaxID=2789856 RepID=A0A7S9QCD1_9RHOB|nr:S8 family serine peptidase [Pontivivens ytuae]QPH54078.1 S8 family serine peptidase [Pontivivens ytuae]